MFQKLLQKVTQLYQAAKQRVAQVWTGVKTWVKAHRGALLLLGTALALGLTGLVGLLLWRRSPAFRAAVVSAVAFVATRLMLKPTLVEAPTLSPVEPSPDGRVKAEVVF